MSRRARHKRRTRNRGHPIQRVALLLVGLVLSAVSVAALAGVGWVVSVANSAPTLPAHPLGKAEPPDVLYNGDASVLGYVVPKELSIPVPAGQIPLRLKQATVAIEDRRFWQHGALDYQGIFRAAVKDIFSRGSSDGLQGASTLTMQLVKNSYMPSSVLPQQRTLSSEGIKYKIIQAKLAEQLQAHHTKAWILNSYLNRVPYGHARQIGADLIGVGAAAEVLFGKPVSKLNLAQVALLAGLPQLPSAYNPFQHPQAARKRRQEVLQAMVQSHYISQGLANAADRQGLWLRPDDAYAYRSDPYIYDYSKQQLINDVGKAAVDAGGLKVYTTISPQLDQKAQAAIAANPPGVQGVYGLPAAALATVDPANGHILAMAASQDYSHTKFFYPAQAERQTGSAFKVFVLMTLIKDYNGDPNQTYYTSKALPAGWLPSEPTWSVHTAEETYQGTINITHATIVSDNTVFVQLAVDEDPFKIDEVAREMGITSPLQGVPAEAIGGLAHCCTMLEMADAYATIANGGYHYPPTIIDKVVFPNGKVENFGNDHGTQVFTDGQTSAAINVLKGVVTSGTGTAANYGCPAAGKTGTAENEDNAWFVGFTPKLSTAVWVGYPQGQGLIYGMQGAKGAGFGGTLAAPIWHAFMQQASAGYCGDWPSPTNPWSGTQFIGPHASASASSSTSGSGSGTSTGGYTNTTLYQTTPQGPPTGGTSPGGGGGGAGNSGGGGGGGTGHGGGGNGHGGGGNGNGGGNGHGGNANGGGGK